MARQIFIEFKDGSERYVANMLDDAAPQTCAAVWDALPIDRDDASPRLYDHSRPGRLAQLVRAPALQAGGRGFEPLTAHRTEALQSRGFCGSGTSTAARQTGAMEAQRKRCGRAAVFPGGHGRHHNPRRRPAAESRLSDGTPARRRRAGGRATARARHRCGTRLGGEHRRDLRGRTQLRDGPPEPKGSPRRHRARPASARAGLSAAPGRGRSDRRRAHPERAGRPRRCLSRLSPPSCTAPSRASGASGDRDRG